MSAASWGKQTCRHNFFLLNRGEHRFCLADWMEHMDTFAVWRKMRSVHSSQKCEHRSLNMSVHNTALWHFLCPCSWPMCCHTSLSLAACMVPLHNSPTLKQFPTTFAALFPLLAYTHRYGGEWKIHITGIRYEPEYRPSLVQSDIFIYLFWMH